MVPSLSSYICSSTWYIGYTLYSICPLIRPPYLPRNCGHSREVTFCSRENKCIDSSSGKYFGQSLRMVRVATKRGTDYCTSKPISREHCPEKIPVMKITHFWQNDIPVLLNIIEAVANDHLSWEMTFLWLMWLVFSRVSTVYWSITWLSCSPFPVTYLSGGRGDQTTSRHQRRGK